MLRILTALLLMISVILTGCQGHTGTVPAESQAADVPGRVPSESPETDVPGTVPLESRETDVPGPGATDPSEAGTGRIPMRVTGISGSVRDGIPAESTYVKPDTFDEIEPFILDYFSAWESGGPVPAAEEVIRRWEAVYSDLSPGSLGDHTYLGGDIDEEGKHSYRFSFRYHRTILDEPDLCILEVVAFGYKHLLEIIRRDDGWTVVKDVGTHGLHSGYTGEAREEAFEIYRRVAVRLTEGLGEEDIEAAREGVKNAFPKIDVFWGIPHTGTEEELRAVMPAVLVEEEYDHEVNIDRIAQWLSYDHRVPLHVPFVILHANVEEAFTLNGYAYSPEKISGYPPVIVKRTEEGWVLAGIVYSN